MHPAEADVSHSLLAVKADADRRRHADSLPSELQPSRVAIDGEHGDGVGILTGSEQPAAIG